MSGAVPERQTPDLGLSTNPTPVELKPCPFCGSAAHFGNINEDGLFFFGCWDCEATGPANETETGAAQAWGTRPPASAAPVDELVEEDATFLSEWAADIDRNAGGHSVDAARLRRIADQLTIYARRVAEKDAALHEARIVLKARGYGDHTAVISQIDAALPPPPATEGDSQ